MAKQKKFDSVAAPFTFTHNGHRMRLLGGQRVLGGNSETATVWYRHDRLEVDGRLLDGYIQVRERRGGRVDTITGHGDRCVLGKDLEWLARENGIELSAQTAHV